MAKVNTSKSVTKGKTITDSDLKKQIQKGSKEIREAKHVKFSIPKEMARYVGSEMFISINGTFVNIPVDGKEYSIPEPLARLGQQTLAKYKM